MAHVGPLMRHHVALHHLFHLFHDCILHGLESFLKISLLIVWRLHIRFHAFSPSRCIPGCWPSLSIRRRWSVDLVLRGGRLRNFWHTLLCIWDIFWNFRMDFLALLVST